MISKPIPLDPELAALLESVKGYVMSPAERLAQRRSWVIGEMMLEHPKMSREEAERLVKDAEPWA
jgi:hypothetical protein